MALDLTLTIPNSRKALIMSDTSPIYDVLGNPIGWTNNWIFADYVTGGSNVASLTINAYLMDGTEEEVVVDLSAAGFFDGVTLQSELVFNLVSIGGVLQVIATDAFDADTAEVLSDGIYVVSYTIEDIGTDPLYDEVFLFKVGAEEILETKALNLDTKIISSNNTDVVQLVDISVLESMMFIVENGDTTSDRTAILNMLNIINNEEYDYYYD